MRETVTTENVCQAEKSNQWTDRADSVMYEWVPELFNIRQLSVTQMLQMQTLEQRFLKNPWNFVNSVGGIKAIIFEKKI